jgi:hypothetical protein
LKSDRRQRVYKGNAGGGFLMKRGSKTPSAASEIPATLEHRRGELKMESGISLSKKFLLALP